MGKTRTARFSVNITPETLARLDAWAAEHHWTRSTAVALLIEQGLPDQPAQAASPAEVS